MSAISSSRTSPDPRIKLESLESLALGGRFFITVPPGKEEEWGKQKGRGEEKNMTKREEREEKGRWREGRGGRKVEKSKCTFAK